MKNMATLRQGDSPVLDPMVSDATLAAELNVTDRALRKWRNDGSGPAYLRIGRGVFYRRSAIERWKDTREFQNSAEELSVRRKPECVTA